jgi:hypothetical protein
VSRSMWFLDDTGASAADTVCCSSFRYTLVSGSWCRWRLMRSAVAQHAVARNTDVVGRCRP